METRILAAAPALPPLLLRAVLGARGRGGPLPDLRLRLEHLAVDRDRLAGYQRLCGFPVGDTLPSTYPHVLGFPLQAAVMAEPDFPLPLPGLVHLHNEVDVHRTLTAWEHLDVAVHATGLRAHPRGRVVDLVTEVDAAGERVWEGRSTYLHRGRPSGEPAAATTAAVDPPPAVPEGPPSAVWRLPADLGRRYAAVSGDVNPIHLHRLTARPLGFRRPIAHGMWSCARVLAALGPKTAGPSTSRVWFTTPVPLPGTVELVVDRAGPAGKATAALRRPSGGPAHLVLTLS